MAIDFEREVENDEAEQRAEERRREHDRRERAEEVTRTAARVARVAVAHQEGLSDQMSAASPVGAMAGLAESLEDTVTDDLDGRMARFPELRDVEMPTGNAARFPELAGDGKPQEREAEEAEELTR